MTHTFIAENLFVDSPWNHCVTSFGPQDELPDATQEFIFNVAQIQMKDLSGYNTLRGTSRKFQHIIDIDGCRTDYPLDRWVHPMKDYMDAGHMWNLWTNCYGIAMMDNWPIIRPDSYSHFVANTNRDTEYAVKMTHWKDVIHTTEDIHSPEFLGADNEDIQIRMMICVTDPGDQEGVHQMTLWRERNGVQQRFFSYLLTQGFALTYNPTNPEALINFNLQKEHPSDDLKRRHQNTWLVFDIIKKELNT